jgi:hypothetical protein
MQPMFDGSAMIYLDSDQVFDEQVRGQAKEYKSELARSANGVYARMPADGTSITSLPLITNLNYFGTAGGFDTLINIIADDSKWGGIGGEVPPPPEVPPPAAAPTSPAAGTTPAKAPAKAAPPPPVAVQIFLERVGAIQGFLTKITHYFQSQLIDAMASRIWMIVARRLLRMDDEETKQVKKATIDSVFNALKLFLKYGTFVKPPSSAAAAIVSSTSPSSSDNKATSSPVASSSDLLTRAPRVEPVTLHSWSGATGPLFTFPSIATEYYAKVELLALELAHRFLASTLPKQVQGVNDIRAFIDIVARKDEPNANGNFLLPSF